MNSDLSRRRLGLGALAAIGMAAFAPFARATPAHGSETPPGEAASLFSIINKAGSLRYTSMRLGKAWAMQALGVETKLAARIRQEAEPFFEIRLAEVTKFSPTSEIGETLTALAQAWGALKHDLALTPNRENAPHVYASSDQSRRWANELTMLYEEVSSTQQAHLVNVSGRQRALLQRMACVFFFNELGAAGESAKRIESARKEFVERLQELLKAPQNTPSIKEELALVEQQWVFFNIAFNGGNHDGRADRNIATTSERILETLNNVTGMYEKLPPGK